MRVCVVGLAAVSAVLFPAPASASILDLASGVLTYTANSGVANSLTVTLASGVYTIDDPAESTITLTAAASAAGCAFVDSNTVQCPESQISSWNVSLGDQNDVANLSNVVEPTVIRGGQGNDTLTGGAGPDTFLWNPGDASDLIDGGPGADTLQFSGANINETFNISATPTGFQLTRDIASVILDVRNVEALSLSTLGADDTVNTVPLTGTTQAIDAGTQTTSDTLNYNSGGLCTSEGTGVLQTLGAQPVNFVNFEAVNVLNECTVFPSQLDVTSGLLTYTAGTGAANQLMVTLAGGFYTIDDSAVPAIQLSAGAVSAGCQNVDVNTVTCPRSAALTSWSVSLGDQADTANLAAVLEPTVIRGGTGNDVITGGAGPDVFLWNPGDASDTLDGGPGDDTLQFSGANINEHFAVSKDLPTGFQLTRDIASVILDVRNVESLTLTALGGDDTVNTVPLPFTTQTFDGGTQASADTFSYEATGLCTTQSPGGKLQTAGNRPVTFTSFESFSLTHNCSNPIPVPALPWLARVMLVALLGATAARYARQSAPGR